MTKIVFTMFAAAAFWAVAGTDQAQAGPSGFYEVVGVEDGDMLKLRSGPGTGYRVIVGLPNGAVLKLHECQQIGSNEWCKVSLRETRALKGYVSWHYLKKI